MEKYLILFVRGHVFTSGNTVFLTSVGLSCNIHTTVMPSIRQVGLRRDAFTHTKSSRSIQVPRATRHLFSGRRHSFKGTRSAIASAWKGDREINLENQYTRGQRSCPYTTCRAYVFRNPVHPGPSVRWTHAESLIRSVSVCSSKEKEQGTPGDALNLQRSVQDSTLPTIPPLNRRDRINVLMREKNRQWSVLLRNRMREIYVRERPIQVVVRQRHRP